MSKMTQDEILNIIYLNIKNKVYDSEGTDDSILLEIKQFCFEYLSNPHTVAIPPVGHLTASIAFLSIKFQEILEIQKALEIENYSWPFTEIAQALDEYTLAETLDTKVHEVLKGKISKDTSNALDTLGFCYGILYRIKQDLMSD